MQNNNTILYNTIDKIHHKSKRYITIQHHAIQHSTIQYNTVHKNKLYLRSDVFSYYKGVLPNRIKLKFERANLRKMKIMNKWYVYLHEKLGK